jgi:hypothetical protein
MKKSHIMKEGSTMSRTTHSPALRVLFSGALAGLGTLVASAAHAQGVTGEQAMLNVIPRLGFEIRTDASVAAVRIDGATALLGRGISEIHFPVTPSVDPPARDFPMDGERALLGRSSELWSPGTKARVNRVDE